MKKKSTYQFAFWCFAVAGLIILFTALTSCSPKVVIVPTAPVHPEMPEWGSVKKTTEISDPKPQKTK
jgi:hypothetical protein